MKNSLVIGASGFVGRHVTRALLADGYNVRCLARKPANVQELATAGCEIVQGDMLDAASLQAALVSIDAVYVSIHTLSAQATDTTTDSARLGFMDVEMRGLQNIVTACRANGVRRLIYVTFLGVSPDAPSEWVRGRWKTEQFLLKTGLDVTIIRPGMIVGVGGQGFTMMVSNAKRRVAIVMGSGQQKFRSIAIDDLVYYLLGVLQDIRTYGQVYDVGSDDVLTANQLIDAVADSIGQRRPAKFHISRKLIGAVAPLIERIGKLPHGAMNGMIDSLETDMIGNPAAIRTLLPQPPLSNRQAIERALTGAGS